MYIKKIYKIVFIAIVFDTQINLLKIKTFMMISYSVRYHHFYTTDKKEKLLIIFKEINDKQLW